MSKHDGNHWPDATPEQIAVRNARTRRLRGLDESVVLVEPALPVLTDVVDTKFHNVPTNVDGQIVDSKKEGRRRTQLRMLGRTGQLSELAFQVEFFLGFHKDENGHSHICVYKADAVWIDKDGKKHVEDTKSEATRMLPAYRMKRRLMKVCLGIEIEEV